MTKKLLSVFVVLVLLVVVIGAGLTLFINTGRYRTLLEDVVSSRTGYELEIAGDVRLSLFPAPGLTLDDVRLRSPGAPQELASSSTIALRVAGRSLLGGQLHVRELRADGLHVNYFLDDDGSSLWDLDNTPGSASSQSNQPPDTKIGDEAANVLFQRISIDNATIDYRNFASGSAWRISDLNLQSRDLNTAGQPFSLDLRFRVAVNEVAEAVDVGLRTEVAVDIDAGQFDFDDVQFNVTPMLLTGQASITDAMRFEGRLESNRFDAAGLLENLAPAGDRPGFSGAASATQPVSFDLEFSGDGSQLVLHRLSGAWRDTVVEGDANVRFATEFAPANVSYQLAVGTVDLAAAFPPSDAGTAAEASDSSATSTGRPAVSVATGLLDAANVQGSIVLESVSANQVTLTDVQLFTNVEDGVLDVELQPIDAYDGSVQGALRLNGRLPEPVLTAQLSLDQLNVAGFAPDFIPASGRLNMESSLDATGTTTEQLLQSLNGSAAFTVTESSVDIGLVKQVFTAIAALSPSGEAIQQWPDEVLFGEAGGYLVFEDGITADQQLRLRMDNLEIDGNGGVDPLAGTFDYDLTFTILGPPAPQTIAINERYHDVAWPVRCAAAFSDEVSRFCRPDFGRVREIFTQIGANALRDRLREEIERRVPEEVQDAARGLLRSIFN